MPPPRTVTAQAGSLDAKPVAQRHLELTGWKAIASYIGVCVRSAIKFADDRGMPVRTWGNRRVMAYADQLDEWRRRQTKPRAPREQRSAA